MSNDAPLIDQPVPGENRCCGTCNFKREMRANPNDIQTTKVCNWGPPHALLVPTGQTTAQVMAVFPPVDDNQVCGQWEPKRN